MDRTEANNETGMNGKAAASLIIGIISLLFLAVSVVGLIASTVGLVFGILGLQEIRLSPQGGKKAAIAGIIVSGFGILIPVFLTIIGFIIMLKL